MSQPHGCVRCHRRCALNYTFCYSCVSLLPVPLLNELRRYYSSSQATKCRMNLRKNAVTSVQDYLDAPDRDAYIWQEARAGAGWAVQTLQDRRLIGPDGIVPPVNIKEPNHV